MLIYEISRSDELTKVVLDQVRLSAPLLNYIHFFSRAGGSAKIPKDANVNTQAQFRLLGTDFTAPVVAAPVMADYALTALGRPLRVDRGFEEQGGSVELEFARQLKSFGLTLGRNINEFLITGDSTLSPKQFNGLKKTVAGLAASQTLTNMGINGMQILAGNSDAAVSSQQKFVEALNQLINSVEYGAQVIVMNSQLLARLTTIAAALCKTTIDQFGRSITTFNGVPVIPAGYKYDGSEVIPQTETKGTSADCSSVYAFRSGEEEHFSMMTTQNGLVVYPMTMVGNFYEQVVELQTDSAALNARSIAVLPGCRLG